MTETREILLFATHEVSFLCDLPVQMCFFFHSLKKVFTLQVAFSKFDVTVSNKSTYSTDLPSHFTTQEGISWPCPSLLASIEHSMPCTALSIVWRKVLHESMIQIFILPCTQCRLHLQNKAPGYTQLNINQEFACKL